MNPVTRALQTIAAIERETHERIHAEAASTCPTESLSHPLSTRSQAFADGRNGPTPRSANSKATADLNGGSRAPSIDQAETTSLEAAFARKREIRIDKRDRVVVAPAHDVTRHPITIIAGALLFALVLCLGWIGGLNSDFVIIKPASPPAKKVDADPPDPAKSGRLAMQDSSAKTSTAVTSSAHEASKRGRQTKHSLLTTPATPASQPTVVERNTKRSPVPETRPTTIAGWTIRQVNGGTAVLEGPNGVWKARQGDAIPGVGKIESIVRWGNRWIVATSGGLISTP
jgi:hypothetical protein